jgi:hypothetical protein
MSLRWRTRPTSFDATLYAFLISILRPPVEAPLKHSALEHAELAEYIARVDRRLAATAPA